MSILSKKISISLFFFYSACSFANILTLENFLNEIKEKNQTITASRLIEESVQKRSKESSLIFKPTIFLQTQMAIDKKPTANVPAQGDQTDNLFLSGGMAQAFEYGIQGKLSLNFSHTEIHNSSPVLLPVSDYHDRSINLELFKSLWRNSASNENHSQANIIQGNTEALKQNEIFKVNMILAKAKSLYWSLSQIRKIVKVEKESLERAIKIKAWNENRYRTGLTDNSDLLQAEANLKAREYELFNGQQEQKSLQRALNAMRGIDHDILDEELESVDTNILKSLPLPKKEELRADTKALFELSKISKANLDLAIEKNKPSLELYGSYAINSRHRNASDATNNLLSKNDHNTKIIGLRFNAPLDFNITKENISGHQNEKLAAELNYNRKLFEQEQLWNDLAAKFNDAKIKLSLVEKITEAHKIKASNERQRLTKGRTVTFQVLNFEQDYAQSELMRIQTETNILNIFSELQTFSKALGDLK